MSNENNKEGEESIPMRRIEVGEPDNTEGEHRLTVEVTKTGEFRSKEEAIQAARKMKKSLEDDSALSMYDIGRCGVLRSDRV